MKIEQLSYAGRWPLPGWRWYGIEEDIACEVCRKSASGEKEYFLIDITGPYMLSRALV